MEKTNEFFNNCKNTDIDAIKEVINFDSLPTFNDFMKSFAELTRDRGETMKKKIQKAGGYIRIMDAADLHYKNGFSTVATVKNYFHQLVNLLEVEQLKVKGDSTGYRFTIKDRYNYEKDYFQYSGDFVIAYNIVLNNKELFV